MSKYLVLAIFGLIASMAVASAQVQVDGYFRRDGTYVQPYMRSNPDRSYNNNWSTSPNVNPYTGQRGTNPPTWNDRPPSNFGLNPYRGR